MKKIIAVILSILMIFSCFGVVGFAADTGKEDESLGDKLVGKVDFEQLAKDFADINFSPDFGTFPPELGIDPSDIETIIDNKEVAKQVTLFPAKDSTKRGFTLYDLYYTRGAIFWGGLAGSTETSSIYTDLTLVKANLNTYLLKLIRKQYGLDTVYFYNASNATKITNFIGHLINADFENVTISTSAVSNEDGFYSTIVKESGLANIIQLNWIDNPKVNYTPVLNALGYDFDSDALLGAYNKYKGDVVAKVLVSSIVRRINQVGPIEYVLSLLSQITASYNLSMYKPLEAIFHSNVVCGNVSADELRTTKGLVNFVANAGKDKTQKIEFIRLPEDRIADATKLDGSSKTAQTDTTEMFLYMFMYLNLVGKHKDNADKIEIRKDIAMAPLSYEDAAVVGSLFDAFFNADMSGLLSNLGNIFTDNINSIKPSITQGFMNFFANYWKAFADFIERIINSLLHFGEF